MTDISMICAGIDVAKSHLDIAIHPGGASLRVTYDKEGLDAIDAFLEKHGIGRVGFEASGGYEWHLMARLRRRAWPARGCSRRKCVPLPEAGSSAPRTIGSTRADRRLHCKSRADAEAAPAPFRCASGRTDLLE